MCDKRIYDADIDSLSPLEVSALMSEDLEDLCRLCMSSEKTHSEMEMVAISEKCPNSNKLISSLLSDVLQINLHDATFPWMPQKACGECLRKLYSYAAFKEQSLSVDVKLRQIVQRKQKISEAQALYGPVFSDLDASFTSSNAPVFFKSECDTRTVSDTSPSAFAPADEDEEKPCVDEQNVEGQWDDDSLIENSETSGNKSQISNIPESGEKFIINTSEKNISTNAVDVNDQIQNVEDKTSCPEIISEIVVSESSAAEDTSAADFVLELEVYDVPSPEVSNANETVSVERVKKSSSSRLPIPEVFAIEGQQAEKQLGFRCPLCKKVFQSRIQFRKHASLHVKAKGGVCKHCDKWFQTSNALCRHERIHSGEKPFVCILCDRTFSQREILQRHILTHTETKPFQCQYCEKSYAQKSGLDGHVKHHHKPTFEISQYPCILCSKAFCHPSGLSRHMLTHSGKQYVCKYCDRNFSDSSALRRHTKNKHGSLP